MKDKVIVAPVVVAPVVVAPVVVAIVGPTGTGKTALSIQLAQRLNGEIVACDSRTIYQYMNIGTAKPTLAQQASIKHHLIDVLEPARFFSIAEYKVLAANVIDDIINRGKVPIVCGGSGLYARALLEGIEIPSVPAQPELRNMLNALASEKGNAHLYEKLKELDPKTAERLNLNDRLRIVRALEVSLITGRPFSSLSKKLKPPFPTLWIGLSVGQRTLHREMLSARLADQLQQGLLEEVFGLWAQPRYKAVLANAVNYKEFLPYINGNETLEQVKQQCLINNSRLSRKQMTWFRANRAIEWMKVDEARTETILAQIIELYNLRIGGEPEYEG